MAHRRSMSPVRGRKPSPVTEQRAPPSPPRLRTATERLGQFDLSLFKADVTMTARQTAWENTTCHFDIDDPGNILHGNQIKLVIDNGKKEEKVPLGGLWKVLGGTGAITLSFQDGTAAITLQVLNFDREDELRRVFKEIRDIVKDLQSNPKEKLAQAEKTRHSFPPRDFAFPTTKAARQLDTSDSIHTTSAAKKPRTGSMGLKNEPVRKMQASQSKATKIIQQGYNPTNHLKPSMDKKPQKMPWEEPSPHTSSQRLPGFTSPISQPLSPRRSSPSARNRDNVGVGFSSPPPHGLGTVRANNFYSGPGSAGPTAARRRQEDLVYRYGMSNKENMAVFAKQQAAMGKKRDGFRNQGQTCYLNAVLQLLYHLNRFKSALLKSSNQVLENRRSSDSKAEAKSPLDAFAKSVSKSLADVFRSKQSSDVVDPVALKNCIGSILKQFSNNDQEDAHELLYALLDQVRMDFDPFGPPDGSVSNPVENNFVWQMQQIMRCRECDYESKKTEMCHDMSLDLPEEKEISGSSVHLRTLLGKYFQEEDVEYACEKCECKSATLIRRIAKLPRFFLIHIKRYVVEMQGKQIFVRKRQDTVTMDENMDFSKWCVDGATSPSQTDTPEESAIDVQDDAGVSSLFAGTTKDDRAEGGDGEDQAPEDPFEAALFGEPKTPDFSKMTEEEQMEYAVSESLKYSSEPPSENVVIDLDSDDPVPEPLPRRANVPPSKYSLQGVINHMGTSYNRGHYVADILDRKSGKWQTFNDDYMSTLGTFRDLNRQRGKLLYILSFQLDTD